MIQALLKEVEGLGCEVTREGYMLKLHDPSVLTKVHKSKLKEAKMDILQLIDRQEQARLNGWLVYSYGEAYEMRVGQRNYVYVFAETNGTYTVWRGTFGHEAYPVREKIIIQGVSFEVAFEKATNYVRWVKK
ncbi:hypothetical protein [Alkalihalobacterium chitinilyticum]|uniref:TubC N-terminal docking domain-containing protein n=1 Tax=Alkalihalobacterium chitinilyticum TaxID=2980103 RepID=A0ABT5VJY7_9BACI|nr:hypothetical protein [Alkalihalobacterium chitinilyticum]MDE5414569.1 hypothetical protein [Alkalihalobacterium chitinilyticum]